MSTARVLQLSPLTGATSLAAVIGDPVRHSLSPVLHNAAFGELGLDWVYVALPVAAGGGPAAVAAMRTLGIAGLSVTMPHKATVVAALDRVTPVAERLGVVNTIVRHRHELVGHSTDGQGFLDALAADTGVDAAGRRVVVLGTGGAARAVGAALANAGVASLGIVGRSAQAVAAVVAVCGAPARAATIGEVDTAEVVVNATPVGMGPPRPSGPTTSDASTPGLPFDLEPWRLGPGQTIIDLIYHPAATELVLVARSRGAVATNGVSMLVHQAAHQFSLWTGLAAPVEVMAAAARVAMAQRNVTGS